MYLPLIEEIVRTFREFEKKYGALDFGSGYDSISVLRKSKMFSFRSFEKSFQWIFFFGVQKLKEFRRN